MDTKLIVFMVPAIFASIQNVALTSAPLHIVNGTTAEEGEFPYMVQLRDSLDFYLCGGAIIGPEWILTAGHCVANGQIDQIIYGTNKFYGYMDGHPNTTILVKNWYQHPKFTRTSSNVPIYDVGLLQLESPIYFSDSATAVSLPEANKTIPFGEQGVLAGWGLNETDGLIPAYLQKINRILLTEEECTKKINDYSKEQSFISTHHICSDDNFDGECNGDSGSPFVINSIVYGLVSWGYQPCGVVPGSYSRITNPEYRNWIKNVTNI